MWVKICNKAIVNSLRCHKWHTGLFIHKYAIVIGWQPTILFVHLLLYPLSLVATTLHPASLPIDPALVSTSLLYSLQLYSIPHKSLCPLSYASYISPVNATQVLTLVYSYKIEKERAIACCLFFMPEDLYSGFCNPTHGQSLTSQLTWAYYNTLRTMQLS